MKKETELTTKTMLAQIAMARDYSQIRDYTSLFADAENIISAMAYLVGPLMDAEQAYRQKVVENMKDESVGSHAKAEALAKAGEEYKEYRKLQYAYDLGQEQIMLIKRFSDKLELEYKRTK